MWQCTIMMANDGLVEDHPLVVSIFRDKMEVINFSNWSLIDEKYANDWAGPETKHSPLNYLGDFPLSLESPRNPIYSHYMFFHFPKIMKNCHRAKTNSDENCCILLWENLLSSFQNIKYNIYFLFGFIIRLYWLLKLYFAATSYIRNLRIVELYNSRTHGFYTIQMLLL